MKKILSISFLLIFVYIQLFNGLVWLSYEINKSEIIEKFCVNKDKPAMKCEGTCHMKKKMLTQDTKDNQKPNTILPEIILFTGSETIELLFAETEIWMETPYSDLYQFYFLDELRHPPKT